MLAAEHRNLLVVGDTVMPRRRHADHDGRRLDPIEHAVGDKVSNYGSGDCRPRGLRIKGPRDA
jgi:hypothetical protein